MPTSSPTDDLRPPPAWVGVAGLVLALVAMIALLPAISGEAKRGLTITLPLGLIGLVLSASSGSTRAGKIGVFASIAALLGSAGVYLWLLSR